MPHKNISTSQNDTCMYAAFEGPVGTPTPHIPKESVPLSHTLTPALPYALPDFHDVATGNLLWVHCKIQRLVPQLCLRLLIFLDWIAFYNFAQA